MLAVAAAALSLLSYQAAARDCDWHTPGANPYRGDPAVAIGKLVEIPPATRAVLAYRVMRVTKYDDIVYIDRDSIQSAIGGASDYHPEITRMNEGGGAICDTVSRKKWSNSHVENAVIYCEDAWCIGRISVCNNWAIFRRTERQQLATGFLPSFVLPVPPVAPLAPGAPGPIPQGEALPVNPPLAYGPPAYFAGPSGGGGWSAMPGWVAHAPLVGAVVTPIPEAPTWAMLAGGLVAVAAWRVRR